ncbi:MAG TPA: DUF1080 domain-containing protein [Armatimonadota bacterium]|jgi:hypothetical protein
MKQIATFLLAAAVAGGALAQTANPTGQMRGRRPPQGAVVLFDGTDTSKWDKAWKVQDGAMVAGGGDIKTKQTFDNFQLHVEFKTPDMPDAKGQAKGNSGVYLQDLYEIQVLDSFGIADPGMGDCGAVYNQSAPLVNACRAANTWQTYDIIFRAARFGADGKMTAKPRVTVLQNNRVVQDNTEINGPTAGPSDLDGSKPGSLRLQDHGNAVSYRNIWIVPLPASGATHY